LFVGELASLEGGAIFGTLEAELLTGIAETLKLLGVISMLMFEKFPAQIFKITQEEK
jgi:hypothetical protein